MPRRAAPPFVSPRSRLLTAVPCLSRRLCAQLDKFANIKEDTPSYVRHHDFFVTVLSSLAWSNETQTDVE